MTDLDILKMLDGGKPGWSVGGVVMWAQRLLVLLMASEIKDIGRNYGGEYAALSEGAVLPSDTLAMKVSMAVSEAVAWMKEEGAPGNLSATVKGVDHVNDHMVVRITVSLSGESTTISMNI